MKDLALRIVLTISPIILLLTGAAIIYALVSGAMPAIKEFGFFSFITSGSWTSKVGQESYGALPFIVGTLLTSILALAFCFPFAISVALFNGEFFKGRKISTYLSTAIDLLSGIPSIVYGLWGFYTLRPLIVSLGLSPQGFGILTASVVLAIMIIPYAASLSSDCIQMVSNDLKEGAYSLGATKAEMIRHIALPSASSGIFSAYVLSLGRALGETMAVTMLIGNTINIPESLTSTGNTMASIIANQFGEADGLKLSSLLLIGLILFLITAGINLLGKYIFKRLNS